MPVILNVIGSSSGSASSEAESVRIKLRPVVSANSSMTSTKGIPSKSKSTACFNAASVWPVRWVESEAVGFALGEGESVLSFSWATDLLGEPNRAFCGHIAIVKTATKNEPAIEKVINLIIHLRFLRLCTV